MVLNIVYIYNVYGPRQVSKGKMATVIGIFEEHYKKNKTLPGETRHPNQTFHSYR